MRDYCRLIPLPKISDVRGNLSFAEGENHVPFKVERVFWIYDVPGGEDRGGHAYKETEEFIIALSGSLDVALDDGAGNEQTFQEAVLALPGCGGVAGILIVGTAHCLNGVR